MYLGRAGGGIVAQVILGPLFIALGLFIGAAIFHVSFMIVGALDGLEVAVRGNVPGSCRTRASRTSRTSFRSWAGSPRSSGGSISWCSAPSSSTRRRRARRSLGMLLPVALCCVCAILGIAFAGAAIFSAFNQ